MSDQSDLSRENILDHARAPRHWGLLHPADVDHTEENPLCGDSLHLTLRFDDHFVIQEVGWEGHGCAISQASASMLGERLIGMTLNDARQISREEMLQMVGLALSPNRMKCALLSLKALVVGTEGMAREK
jgi:nitrogen fixation protein NifU and related proteins